MLESRLRNIGLWNALSSALQEEISLRLQNPVTDSLLNCSDAFALRPPWYSASMYTLGTSGVVWVSICAGLQRIPSSHLPMLLAFRLPSLLCPGVKSSALSISTAGTTAKASTVPLRVRLLWWLRFIAAATSLFFTSFLILGHSSLALSDDEIDELLRRNGDNDDSDTALERALTGKERDCCDRCDC